MVSLRRVLLLTMNVVSTTLTVLTGLRENVIIQTVVGGFDSIRARLQQGRINYNIAILDLQPSGALPDLVDVGSSYNFHQTPTRSPLSLGDDRSVCLRVNSVSASSLALHYDDVFGRGPRREQVFLYSISAPRCSVINFKPEWVHEQCTKDLFRGNTTACYEYILDQFETLAHDRSIQAGSTGDFGEVGAPFLKCVGRPRDGQFMYMTDHLVLQSFWAGADYHVEIQSSECWAMPVLPNTRQLNSFALFRAESVDAQAVVVVAVPARNASVQIFSLVYAVVTLALVVKGLIGVFSRRSRVCYLPWPTRATTWRLPFVDAVIWSLPAEERARVVRLHGKATVAANSWMNHWLYISLNIAYSVLHIRTLYVLLEVGAWMLTKQVSFENFLFVCTALTKLTWITCLAHSVLQRSLHIVFDVATAFLPRVRPVVALLRWYVDATALLTSFKVYSILLLIQLYGLLQLKGSTSFMDRRPGFKRPVYGGYAGLASMWGSEITCDLVVIISIQVAAAHVLASLLLLSTRLRVVTTNRVLRLLQDRFVFIGWDVFVAMDALGIDPFREEDARVAPSLLKATRCSLAALVRQLYASGPSGWVHLAGDEVFDRSDAVLDKRRGLEYPLEVAERIGFKIPTENTPVKRAPTRAFLFVSSLTKRTWRAVTPDRPQLPELQSTEIAERTTARTSAVDERELHVLAESPWGSVILVDYHRDPGRLTDLDGIDGDTAKDRVFTIMDSLCLMDADELNLVCNNKLQLRIR